MMFTVPTKYFDKLEDKELTKLYLIKFYTIMKNGLKLTNIKQVLGISILLLFVIPTVSMAMEVTASDELQEYNDTVVTFPRLDGNAPPWYFIRGLNFSNTLNGTINISWRVTQPLIVIYYIYAGIGSSSQNEGGFFPDEVAFTNPKKCYGGGTNLPPQTCNFTISVNNLDYIQLWGRTGWNSIDVDNFRVYYTDNTPTPTVTSNNRVIDNSLKGIELVSIIAILLMAFGIIGFVFSIGSIGSAESTKFIMLSSAAFVLGILCLLFVIILDSINI